jgi:hypothetical protein
MRCKNLILFDRNQQSVAGLGLIKRIAAAEEAVSINRQDVRDRPSALSQAVTVRSVFHTILIGELGGATLLAGGALACRAYSKDRPSVQTTAGLLLIAGSHGLASPSTLLAACPCGGSPGALP